jgi:hypothetical protein
MYLSQTDNASIVGFSSAMPPEGKHPLGVFLFLFLFGVPLQLAQPWTKGGVCFHASDFVLED